MITDWRITDHKNFEAATGEPRQIAGLYFYQLLDCLVDLAHEFLSITDYYKRPQLYRDLGDPELQLKPVRNSQIRIIVSGICAKSLSSGTV